MTEEEETIVETIEVPKKHNRLVKVLYGVGLLFLLFIIFVPYKVVTLKRCLFSVQNILGIHNQLAQDAYQTERRKIELLRQKLAKEYMGKSTDLNTVSQNFHDAVLNRLGPFWHGTPHSYYGTTVKPGQGHIACGYFVSTLFQHAGVKVNRIKLAQQPSADIINTFTHKKYIRRYSHVPIKHFVQEIKKWGDGLYIVGLDFHVGFISVEKSHVRFIHASGFYPKCVINESAKNSPSLIVSKLRVVGKISADPVFLRKWLKGSSFSVVGNY